MKPISYWLAATLAAGALPAAATTAQSGTLAVVANATLGTDVESQLNNNSWAAVPTTLTESASVTANDGADFATTSGAATATWASADAGAVNFNQYGWTWNVNNGEFVETDLTQNRGGDDWTYTFTATQNGTFSMAYNVAPTTTQTFGLWGWSIDWSGAGGGLPVSNPFDPTASGVFTRSILAGQTYTVGLNGNPNLSSTGGDFSSFMNGQFNWSIAGVPEPATWAMMLVGFGGMGAAMRVRRKSLATAA